MKYDSFIKKLKKRLGAKEYDLDTRESATPSVNGHKEWLMYEGTLASWRVQPSDWRDPKSAPEVAGFHSRRANDLPDSMTDYFPGTYWDNATQLIDSLEPPPAKYPAGSLVRGKDNKRAKRCGYVGRHALVTKSHCARYFTLQFVGEINGRTHGNYYPVRDFELVS